MQTQQPLNILIIGATSAIAQAVAKQLANENHSLFLVARNQAKLNIVATDLKARTSANVETMTLDINAFQQHEKLLTTAKEKLGRIDLALIAHGTLSDQSQCQNSFALTQQEFNTNCMSVISLLTLLGNYFEQQKQGCIAVISSVAGDRGRQSNYVYGTAKAAVSTFLQGLRNRLQKYNVAVLTIKPGFVDTPMTAEFAKKGFLWAQPEKVADDILKAIKKKKAVLYTPGFWRYIMLIIKMIPEKVFMRLSM